MFASLSRPSYAFYLGVPSFGKNRKKLRETQFYKVSYE